MGVAVAAAALLPEWRLLSTSILLRLYQMYALLVYCRAALQLACDAPSKTIVSQHAKQLPVQPCAQLLTKEEDWSPLLSTLTGHTGSAKCVAMVGNTIVSGSFDQTVR